MVKPFEIDAITQLLKENPAAFLFEHLDEKGELPAYGKIVSVPPGGTQPSNVLVALPRLQISYIDLENRGTPSISCKINDQLFEFLDALYRASGVSPEGLDREKSQNVRLRLKYYGKPSIVVTEGCEDDSEENHVPFFDMEQGGYIRACVQLSSCAFLTSADGEVKKTVLFSTYKGYYVPPPVEGVGRKRSRIEF